MSFEVIGRPTYGQPALVVVPKIGKQDFWTTVVKPGSSLVAYSIPSVSEGPIHKVVYFEGNVHNACNLLTFHERAQCAYDRMAMSYPTVAKIGDAIDSLEVIGLISPTAFEIQLTSAYLAWIARDPSLAP